MTKPVIYKCHYCKILWNKTDVRPELCPRCEKPDWSMKPIKVKTRSGAIVGSIEYSIDGLVTFFPEKLVTWNIKQLANLIKSMSEADHV